MPLENHVNIVAEIGLNYAYGNNPKQFMDNAKYLIRVAAVAGCDYIKMQKRNPVAAVPEAKKDEPKTVPWRSEPTTYLQYKEDIEFSIEQYKELHHFAKKEGIELFASVWDATSAEAMREVTNIAKIPSAKINDKNLLTLVRGLYDFRIMSTGMSTESEISQAVDHLKPHVIMHTNSVYPTPAKDLKLGYIQWLKEAYGRSAAIGYSNHYYGTKAIYTALGMGVSWVEFHITKNHDEWGSDQAASIEPHGVFEITKAVRDFEGTIIDGYAPRKPFSGEEKKRKDLR